MPGTQSRAGGTIPIVRDHLYAAIPALDFVDALLVAYREHEPLPTVISFDQEFDRVPGITREAP